MKTHCTRPGCPRPSNVFPDLDDRKTLKTVQQKFCTACGMPQILGGRYIPLKLLGQGGFGAAFLAVDRYTPKMRQCVVKQFQPSSDLKPEQLKIAQDLFDREAEALEDLGNRHQQIPNLFAFFELQVPGSIPQKSEDYFYLVQEFIDGLNMEEELAQRGLFSEAEVLEILTEVLKILKFVHDHNAIHRDIKPSNVMRSRQGRIYLLDFGAVKQSTVGQAAKAGQQRSTGIYSMGFAPPEQMQGDKVYPATDLYALGVTCISLLTGKEPTDLYDSYSNTWNWRSYAQVSDRLEAIFNRMLQPVPRERFQAADDVLNALRPLYPSSTPQQQSPASYFPSNPSSPATPGSSSTSLQGRAGVAQSNPTIPPPAPVAPPPPPAPIAPPPAPVAPPPPPVAPISVASPAPMAVPTPVPGSVRTKGTAAQKTSAPSRPLSSLAVIKGAMFTGFETGLLAIAALSFAPSPIVALGIIAAGFVGLALLQIANIVGGSDLPIFAVFGLLLALGLHQFKVLGGFSVLTNLLPTAASHLLAIVLLPVMAGLLVMAGAIIFLLVYRLLSRFL